MENRLWHTSGEAFTADEDRALLFNTTPVPLSALGGISMWGSVLLPKRS